MTEKIEFKISFAISGMTRTQAYKCWGMFRKEVTPREFKSFVQKQLPLSERYYECKALEMPPIVPIPKHIGKKKIQFLKGLRTSKSRKNNIRYFIKIINQNG